MYIHAIHKNILKFDSVGLVVVINSVAMHISLRICDWICEKGSYTHPIFQL